ncbi:MAG: S1 RNA-binding domain-containing protein [Myxococcales bacterium]|nr:S1 RNA-binding domain-containing protein [Myxococcales bacterium]
MSDPPEKSFAALFEEANRGAPPRRRPRVGETVDAVVVQIGREAVFVELESRQQGFIDPADLQRPDGALHAAVGDRIRARIASSDPEAGLRLVPTLEAAVAAGAGVPIGPAERPEAVKIAVGMSVTGEVSRVESYGVFLQIAGTKGRAGRGLIPLAELGVPRGADLRKGFPLGTKLPAKVLQVADGKITLSLRALKDDEERAQFEGFRDSEKAAGPGFGTFGDLLKRTRK